MNLRYCMVCQLPLEYGTTIGVASHPACVKGICPPRRRPTIVPGKRKRVQIKTRSESDRVKDLARQLAGMTPVQWSRLSAPDRAKWRRQARILLLTHRDPT